MTARRALGRTGDVLLWIASVAGALCIAVVLAATVFHVTLIMFKTGSMEPTIPTGSLAVVHRIPASEIRVGDIVTVDRAGELPVTHRVTSISDAGAGSPEVRSITLRGDANPTEDAAPYLVEDVRVVWAWLPGWAQVVVWFSNPLVLGLLTVGATGLVTWAFWPREERSSRDGGSPRPTPTTRRPRVGRPGVVVIRGVSIGLSVAALGVAGAIVPASGAQAVEVETVTRGTYLQLTSISDPDLMSDMQPGVPVTWQVGVDAFPPEPGLVHLGIAASGGLSAPGDMTIEVRACDVRWTASACSAGAELLVPTTDLAAAVAQPTAYGAREITAIDASDQIWLLTTVTLTAPQGAAGRTDLRLQAWGMGVPISTGPSGGLAMTGSDARSIAVPLALSGSAILGGLLLATIARRRRPEVAYG